MHAYMQLLANMLVIKEQSGSLQGHLDNKSALSRNVGTPGHIQRYAPIDVIIGHTSPALSEARCSLVPEGS